jgi:hypothetical protein
MASDNGIDYKAIALYLADVHAATAEYDGRLKSTSKSRRERLQRICESAKAMFEGTTTPPAPVVRDGYEERVMARLERAAKQEAGNGKD